MKFKNLVLVFVIGMMALMSCSNANAASAEKQKNELVDVVKTAIKPQILAANTQTALESSVIDVSISDDRYYTVITLDDTVFEVGDKLVIQLKNIVEIKTTINRNSFKKKTKDNIPIAFKEVLNIDKTLFKQPDDSYHRVSLKI